MRALILSDFHGHRKAFLKAASEAKRLKADLIVVCGDITNFGHAKQARPLLTPLTSLNLPLLYVPGNCDLSSFLEEKISISFGCLDSRKFAEIGRDRLAVGIPRKLFKVFV